MEKLTSIYSSGLAPSTSSQPIISAVLLFALSAVALAQSAPSGWYLLVPPSSEFDEHAEFLSGYKILDTKPLRQWSQQGAYDSAAECETIRDSLRAVEYNAYSLSNQDYISAVGSKKNPALLKHMRWTTERHNANANAFAASRCVASNDSRLKK